MLIKLKEFTCSLIKLDTNKKVYVDNKVKIEDSPWIIYLNEKNTLSVYTIQNKSIKVYGRVSNTNISDQYASKILKDVFKHYKKYLALSRKQAHHMRTNFSLDNMTEKFTEIMAKVSVPERVELKLTKLKKV